jgi:hypothetical protein
LWTDAKHREYGGDRESWRKATTHKENRREIHLMAIAQFPPLPTESLPASLPGNDGDPFEHLSRLPDSSKVGMVDAVRWVWDNLTEYRRARDSKSKAAWKSIEKRAPSRGVVQLLEAAYINHVKFTQEVVPKVLGGKDEGEDEKALRKATRKQLTMVDEILAEVRCPKCGELLG